MAAAAGLNIGLNMIVIPLYGIVGAALATVLSEGLVLLMMFFTIYKTNIMLDLRPVLRPLLAAGIMGAGLIILGTHRSLVLCLGSGFVFYVLALTLIRGIPYDVRLYLRNSFPFAKGLCEKFWRI